ALTTLVLRPLGAVQREERTELLVGLNFKLRPGRVGREDECGASFGLAVDVIQPQSGPDSPFTCERKSPSVSKKEYFNVKNKAVKNGGVLCPGTVGSQTFGYSQVSPKNRYFYSIIEADENPSTAPTFIHLAGGPGVSAMDPLLEWNGPCLIQADGRSLTANDFQHYRDIALHHFSIVLTSDCPFVGAYLTRNCLFSKMNFPPHKSRRLHVLSLSEYCWTCWTPCLPVDVCHFLFYPFSAYSAPTSAVS
ncbi:hypothetical protein FOL47_000248, partial [Perkinsus chesapeaki]